MSFQYACFISYRHNTRTKKFVDRLAVGLKEELELLLVGESNKIFRDNDFLRYGDDIETEIAQAICKSVCLLIVYVPNTYQHDHPFCAREYAAMCELEKYRLKNVRKTLRPSHGPILTLPFRGSLNTMPSELAKRKPYDFGVHNDLSNDSELQYLPAMIAEDIAKWCDLFATDNTLPTQTGNCEDFNLPQESSAKAREIIKQQQCCGFSFPNSGR